MNIVAIGGGRRGPILETIVDQLETPRAVLIPTACSVKDGYDKKVPACLKSLVGLGLETEILHAYNEDPSSDKVSELIGRASLVYIIGGNTPTLLAKSAEYGTDNALREGAQRGLWITGTSAGALLPFTYGMSCPVSDPETTPWEYEDLTCLDIFPVPARITAHASSIDPHPTRQEQITRFDHFQKTMPRSTDLGFAIENNAALIMDGDTLSVRRAKPEAAVHVIHQGEAILDIRDDEQLTEIVTQYMR